MQTAAIIVFGFILLAVQSTLAHILPWDMFVPNAALAIVLYMGLHDYEAWRGAIIAFIIGYFMDSFAGSPIGLFTFVSVAGFLISRVAALRLFLQGWIFEIILTLFLALVASGLVLLIRALFDQDFGSLLTHLKVVLSKVVATALVAPFVFSAMKRLEQITVRRKSDSRKVLKR